PAGGGAKKQFESRRGRTEGNRKEGPTAPEQSAPPRRDRVAGPASKPASSPIPADHATLLYMNQYPQAGTPVTAAGDPAIAKVAARVQAEEISLIWFLYADHGGIIRGKAASAEVLPARMVTGIGHTVAMMAMSMLDHLQPVE